MFLNGKRAAARPRSAGGLSFIGPDVVVSGNVLSSSQIHVDGRVDGDVRCESLIQGPGGIVAGNIAADSAHLSGLVDGTVQARLVALEPSARVTGDVTYETLSIAAGAAIEGRLTRREAGAVVEITRMPEKEPAGAAKRRVRIAKADEPALLPMPELPDASTPAV